MRGVKAIRLSGINGATAFRIGMRNLAIAFPERSHATRRRILRHSLQNLGRTAVEFVRLPQLSDEQLREMVRFEDEAWWAA